MAYGRGGRGGYGGRGGGYSGRKGGGQRTASPRTSARLTGLFPAKSRDNLFVGSTDGDSLRALIDVIKKADAAKAGVTFFLWANDRGDKAAFTLYADVDQSGETPRASRRPIADEEDTDEPEYKPFED